MAQVHFENIIGALKTFPNFFGKPLCPELVFLVIDQFPVKISTNPSDLGRTQIRSSQPRRIVQTKSLPLTVQQRARSVPVAQALDVRDIWLVPEHRRHCIEVSRARVKCARLARHISFLVVCFSEQSVQGAVAVEIQIVSRHSNDH